MEHFAPIALGLCELNLDLKGKKMFLRTFCVHTNIFCSQENFFNLIPRQEQEQQLQQQQQSFF